MIGRQRQNRFSAPAIFVALPFQVLLLSSMCATASFVFGSFRKFSQSGLLVALLSKSAGKNKVIIAAGVPLFFRRAREEIEILR